MTIWFASGNAHKKKELASILEAAMRPPHAESAAAPFFSALKIPADAGLAFDPDETGNSFQENALIKAIELYRLLCDAHLFNPGDAIIADDSGLCVDALDGRPGIYSARYAGPPASAGSGAALLSAGAALSAGATLSVAEKNDLILSELADNPRRSARFVCAMVLLFSTDNFYIAQETLEGRICESRGTGGFGYDPIMFLPEFNRTVAELTEAEKNAVSHRGKAARVIAGIIKSTARNG
jgi:XTP/dITP diphosphohydrolase